MNELNDEMSALIKLLIIDEEPEDEQNNPDQNESHEDEEDTDEWHEVGAKNKSLLVRIELYLFWIMHPNTYFGALSKREKKFVSKN